MNELLTTSDVPPQFWKAAFLVGQVPFRTLRSDPRISFALYIPPSRYKPRHSASIQDERASAQDKLPLLVYIHGSRRNVSALYTDLVPFADSTPCAILVPLFPVGMDGPNDLDSYKVLRSTTLRSDLVLLSILDEVAICWPGIDTDKIFLMGFSGGGQFAHRFLYLHPERLVAVSVGAPGRSTLLDDQQDWPIGLSNVEAIFNRVIMKDLIGKVRIQLVIGSTDVNIHGGRDFMEWLKDRKTQASSKIAGLQAREPTGLQPMVQGRQDTLQKLQASWKKEGIEAQLDVVEGVSHAAAGVSEYVLRFLQPLMQGRF